MGAPQRRRRLVLVLETREQQRDVIGVTGSPTNYVTRTVPKKIGSAESWGGHGLRRKASREVARASTHAPVFVRVADILPKRKEKMKRVAAVKLELCVAV